MLEYWMGNNSSGSNESEFEIEEVLEDPGSAMLFTGYPSWLLYFAASCCVLFMLIGIPGNLITVAALFRTRKLRNATAVFIMNLSLSDLMFCCFNLPLATSTFWHGSWLHGPLLCRLFPLLRYGLVAVSLFTVLAITINRYVMIGHPRLYPKLYKPKYLALMVLATWTFAFGALVVTWFGLWGRFGLDPVIGSCSILPDANGRSPKEFLFILAFLTPCMAIVVCYARIFYIVRRTAVRSRRNKITADLRSKSNLEVRYTKNCEDSVIGSSCGATLTTMENGSSPTRIEKTNFLSPSKFSPTNQGLQNNLNFEYSPKISSKLDDLRYGRSTVNFNGNKQENGRNCCLKKLQSNNENLPFTRNQSVAFDNVTEYFEIRENEGTSNTKCNLLKSSIRNENNLKSKMKNQNPIDSVGGNSTVVENTEREERENEKMTISSFKKDTPRVDKKSEKNQSVTFDNGNTNSSNFEDFTPKSPSDKYSKNKPEECSKNLENFEFDSCNTREPNLDGTSEDIPFIDTIGQNQNGNLNQSQNSSESLNQSSTPILRFSDVGPEIRLEEVTSNKQQRQILDLENLEARNCAKPSMDNSLQVPRKYLQDLECSSENFLSPRTMRYDEISEDYGSSRSDSPSERRTGKKTNILRRESRFKSMRNCSFETGKMTAKDKKLLKMILVIFSSFLICYLPITITKIFKDVIDWRGLNIAGYILIYLTTCINPVIYVVMSSEYRSAYKNVLLCRSDSSITTSKQLTVGLPEKKKTSNN